MHAFLRAAALGAAISVASPGFALAAQIDVKPPGAMALNATKVVLANGQSIYCRKAGGDKWEVFIDRDGKQVPAPPGSYKQKNGNVILVGARGMVSPGSKVMLNPQPLPP
jgi:hypothetical protein